MCAEVGLLHRLKVEIYNQRPTGFLVCEECLDKDNPQLQLGKFPVNDPQALFQPRVDTNVLESRELWGWFPVGNTSTQIICKDGGVSVNGLYQIPVRENNP